MSIRVSRKKKKDNSVEKVLTFALISTFPSKPKMLLFSNNIDKIDTIDNIDDIDDIFGAISMRIFAQ